MEEAKKALIAEVEEITGKGRGEQRIEMSLQTMKKEAAGLSTKPGMRFLGFDLGMPALGGWADYPCPSCGTALRYLFVPPPYGTPLPLKCPQCGAPLGISGSEVVKTVQTEPVEPSPTYQCPHCGETFGSWARLFDHIATAHQEIPVTPPSTAAKIGEWMKEHWVPLSIGGLGVALTGTVIVKRRKRR